MARNDIYDMNKDYTAVTFDSFVQYFNAMQWCEEQGWKDFVAGGKSIYFEDAQQATMCALRWC